MQDIIIRAEPSQLIATIAAICGLIVAAGGAVAVIARFFTRLRKPQTDQNARLDSHEKRLDCIDDRLDQHEQLFKNDKSRLEELENGNKVTQKALLALLSHALDGNDVESLRDAKADLEKYLINR